MAKQPQTQSIGKLLSFKVDERAARILMQMNVVNADIDQRRCDHWMQTKMRWFCRRFFASDELPLEFLLGTYFWWFFQVCHNWDWGGFFAPRNGYHCDWHEHEHSRMRHATRFFDILGSWFCLRWLTSIEALKFKFDWAFGFPNAFRSN